MLGCRCPVCLSSDPKNNRTRASLWLRTASTSIVIDTSTDFRHQALREGIESLDALLYTHAHADHIHGLDDIRPFSWKKPIAAYGDSRTLNEIKGRFAYIFGGPTEGGGKPRLSLNRIAPGDSLLIGDIALQVIPLLHGTLPTLGFRIGKLAYLTDCSALPPEAEGMLQGIELLIIDALREKPHPTHFSLKQAIATARHLGARKTWLTHMCHDLEHKALSESLPDGIAPAWDGLAIPLPQG